MTSTSTTTAPAVSPRQATPRPARSRRRGRARGPFQRIGRPLVWAWATFNVLLLVWIVLQSFRNGAAIFSDPFGLPASVSFKNYTDAWNAGQFGSSFLNSIAIAGASTLTILILAAPAAYVLARSSRRVASPLISGFALGMSIPVQAVVIPIFVLMQSVSTVMFDTVGWWDDRLSLYIVYVAINLPFAVFLLTGFVRTLPGELEEAAALDGAGPVLTFVRIMIPLTRSGLITAFILTLINVWNETLLSLVFITDNTQYTLPQALLGLYGTMQYTSNWGGLFAGVVIVMVPIIVAYVLLGRWIVEGMTLGAGK